MKIDQLTTRDDPNKKDLAYRTMSVRLAKDGSGPATLDTEARSFEVIGASETPCDVYDYMRGEVVPEVLLMDGLELPKSRQVPLLDSHNRWDTGSVIGSYREMKTEGGHLVGRVFFSSTPESESPYTKAREGHLTDFSVGYRVVDSQWVPKGEKVSLKGRSFEGPVRVTTRWRVKELSICPIGADETAKARSENQPTPSNEENKMNERLRKFLESRGLAKDATEDQAWTFLEALERKEAGGGDDSRESVDVDKLRREATGEERERIISIDAICEQAGKPDLARKYIADGFAVDKVRQEILELVLAGIKDGGGHGHRTPVRIVADERDKFRSASVDALSMRTGIKIEAPAEGARDLMGYSLRELARHSLVAAGQRSTGDPMDMVKRALQTSDFPVILGAVANKSLMDGWESAPETWNQWCATGSVNDFKTHTAVRASETDDLLEIPEKGDYKYGERDEAFEQYSIATYGRMMAITRQAIINDDLSALSDVPRRHGESAARLVGDVAYAVLTVNANMGDGTALFAAGHGNLVAAGNGAAPGIVTLAAAIFAMKSQTDIKGLRRLNIRPEFYLAPVALEGVSEIFFRSERFSDTDTIAFDSSLASSRVNPYAGSYFSRIYEPRLDDASATQWYLAARSNMTVKVFFLNGNQTPYMETQPGWNVDGLEYKVRMDVGAKAMDWRGLYANAGA